ncbi:MAG: T9SS type A sorting domain-containing protein [Bacteroidia bacterium]
MSKFLTMRIALVLALSYFPLQAFGQCPNDVIRMALINPSSGPNIGLEPHGIWAESMFCGTNFSYFYILPNSYLDVYADGTGAVLHGSAKIIRGGNCLSNPNDTFYFHSSFMSADQLGLNISGKDNLPPNTLNPDWINDWLFFVANDDDSYLHNGTDTIWAPHFFGANPSVNKFGLQIGYGANGKNLAFGMAWWLTYHNGTRTGMADYATELDTVCVPPAPSLALCPDQEIVKGLATQDVAQITSTVSGGVPPYQYSWTNAPDTTPDIVVSPNSTTVYTLTVTDALNRTDVAAHTVTVHDISASNGKVYMCNNKKKPKTKKVNLSSVSTKLGQGYTLGSCGTSIDLDAGSCGEIVPPTDYGPCDCDGRIKELTLVYSGPDNVTINVYSLQGQTPTSGSVFTGVMNGDTIITKSSDAGLSRFGPNTRFEIEGYSSLNQEIHTSCSQEILGKHFGVFYVLGHVDFNNNKCGTTFTPPPSSPPTDPPSSCDCEGRIKELTVVYSGPGNVDINVFSLQGQTPTAATSFTNVQTGDTLVAKSSDANLGRFGPNTRFEVAGNSSLNQTIHTSCSQEILGFTFGSFYVAAHTDYNDNQCGVPGPDPDPDTASCPQGVTRLELINPSQGANIGLTAHGIWAADLFCDNTNVTYFYVLPESYLDLNQDGSGAVMYGSARVIAGDNCLPVAEQDAVWQFHAEFYDPADSGLTISGKDNYPGGMPDTSVINDWIFLVADNSASYLYKGTDTIYMPHFFGVNPSVQKFGMQIGENANGKNLSYGMAWWFTYVNGSRTGVGDYSTELDTICVGEPIPPAPPAPPAGPCDCEGRMKEVQVVYSGPSNVTISTKSMQGNRNGTNATVFNNVQDGDTLVAKSSDASLDRFGPFLDFFVSGNSNLDQRIHTSCSQDILGNTYGAFYVHAHTDYQNNHCNATLNPMMVQDEQDQIETGLANETDGGHQPAFGEMTKDLETQAEKADGKTTHTASGLEVYPNPFNNQVQISFYNKSNEGNTVLKVTDALGKVILREVVSGSNNAWIQRTVEINGKAGLYILSIENAEGLQTKRLIKF